MASRSEPPPLSKGLTTVNVWLCARALVAEIPANAAHEASSNFERTDPETRLT
jgi:hypothetical protein